MAFALIVYIYSAVKREDRVRGARPKAYSTRLFNWNCDRLKNSIWTATITGHGEASVAPLFRRLRRGMHVTPLYWQLFFSSFLGFA